ncbi:MAG: electron transport complex subunit RsxB [Nitrosomonadaceae bacterium]|nr:electron transport complex subunit RsxB [Nitrosomonadaceae bacterium]|tara:strand:+ start:7134 stop:7784 length:651 start_codon:yes stop_codon:yes gene_type:complete
MLIEKIDSLLPQTQCGKCGFSGCKPYAKAIAEGLADINQCPPGNDKGILKLANLLGVKPKPLNTAHGSPKPDSVALIDEETCIGCTFCIQVCPVDAIVGAPKKLHTVISSECTGCELCLAPCPVDCIIIKPLKDNFRDTVNDPSIINNKNLKYENKLRKRTSDYLRMRYERRLKRLEREKKNVSEKFIKQTKRIKPSSYIATIKSLQSTKQFNKIK